jgi:hypothetical protein
MSLAAVLPMDCNGQERDPSQMSREEWQAQVEASRHRVEMMRRHHEQFIPRQPTLEEASEAASRRVLEDASLLPGDIVSTNRGLFRFRGNPNRGRIQEDFVRIR